MFYPDRLNFNAFELEGFFSNRVKINPGNARVVMARKNIGKLLLYLIEYPLFGIQRHVGVLHKVIGPYIIKAGSMVLVLVGKKQTV